MNYRLDGKRILKKDAVPSQNLRAHPCSEKSNGLGNIDKNTRMRNRREKDEEMVCKQFI
jgi:hypothetical protein